MRNGYVALLAVFVSLAASGAVVEVSPDKGHATPAVCAAVAVSSVASSRMSAVRDVLRI